MWDFISDGRMTASRKGKLDGRGAEPLGDRSIDRLVGRSQDGREGRRVRKRELPSQAGAGGEGMEALQSGHSVLIVGLVPSG